MMDIDELRTVQTKERQKDSLQHLRDSFYEDVAAYVADLKQRRQDAADASSDPFADPDVSRLTDEIEAAEEVVEAVYERRVGKVVKHASFAAADMPVEEEGLTVQERDLFEDIVSRINENKDRVLEILAGEGDTGPAPGATGSAPVGAAPDPNPDQETEAQRSSEDVAGGANSEPSTANTEADVPPGASTADETPSRSEPAVATGDAGEETEPDEEGVPPAPPKEAQPGEPVDESAETESERGRPDGGVKPADNQRTTVRIIADVGSLLGMDDREYDLRSEDVVSLPEDNADALVQREAAKEL